MFQKCSKFSQWFQCTFIKTSYCDSSEQFEKIKGPSETIILHLFKAHLPLPMLLFRQLDHYDRKVSS